MAYEIERKFLVKADYKPYVFDSQVVKQGYIVPNGNGRNVRIRIKGNKGFITIKGPAIDGRIGRFEWEKEIPQNEAEDLLKLCTSGIIHKIRHLVKVGNHTFEVDEFLGENIGLTIAEVELASEDEQFVRPHWLGDEVTHDKRYYNSYLSRHPFREWR